MLSSSRLEAVACRFDPVIKDLRSFLKDNDVAYGFPEHLLAFTDRLTEDEALRYATSSKLHTVVAEFAESTSHGDLVEMLLLTVGGFAVDEDTPPMQQAERVLSRFIGEVMTSTYTIAPGPPPSAPLPAPPAPLTAPPLTQLQDTIAEPESQLGWAAFLEIPMSPATLANNVDAPSIAKPTALPTRLPPNVMPAAVKALLARLPKRAPSSQPFTWTPAPRFVWAALVCGALFPPGMYLISQPHAASPAPLHPDAKAPRPAVDPQLVPPAQAAQPTELDRQTDEDLASIAALGFGSSAGQTRFALSHYRKLRNRQALSAKQAVPTVHPFAGSNAPGAGLVPRETDMPGRDVSSLAPASPGSQDH